MDLNTIIELSHEFGGTDYVKGGGGNTSAKDESVVWVKPSGTTLKGLTRDRLVGVSRPAVEKLFETETPRDGAAREEMVRDLMARAVVEGAGRPSVEAPLHHVFDATYVVHTHAILVNGMTCARNGAQACAELFPDALWAEYIDPGYTLCMEIRKRIDAYRAEHGRQPSSLILENHGIFVAADTAQEIREIYGKTLGRLKEVCTQAGCSAELSLGKAATSPQTEARIRECFGDDAAFLSSSGWFPCVAGPINPDQLLYTRASPFTDEISVENADRYRAERGYAPKVVVADDRVYGVGTSQKNADLALAMAQDAAQIAQLADAFGGIQFMSDRARDFIESWEVEHYREKVIGEN
ncbi:MAG: class II aldolase/adducin family protein [Verrucomicrobia bacterium]|nr:class II aldolase/adducin family protein [Verrucomicrobiota bacterium]MDA1085818.1 class II aldolase/adducin family protein [Verrucomicrobiota bacterium]